MMATKSPCGAPHLDVPGLVCARAKGHMPAREHGGRREGDDRPTTWIGSPFRSERTARVDASGEVATVRTQRTGPARCWVLAPTDPYAFVLHVPNTPGMSLLGVTRAVVKDEVRKKWKARPDPTQALSVRLPRVPLDDIFEIGRQLGAEFHARPAAIGDLEHGHILELMPLPETS